jgi:hypothetical protein
VLDPNHVLMCCPNCHAWPMAANFIGSKWASQPQEIDFRCAMCGHVESVAIASTGELTAISSDRRSGYATRGHK